MKNTNTHFFIGFCLFFILLILASGTSLSAQPCNYLSSNVNLGGSSHDVGFQENDAINTAASLSNGNFVVAWETRDDVDGDKHGGFFQIFDEDGAAVTGVMIPYDDINMGVIGDQGTFGPKVVPLTTGFVIGWESEDGPLDTGPVGEDQQDVYFRIYNNDGSPITGSTQVIVADQEDHLEYILPLNTGGFVMLTKIDKDMIGSNKDDYFFQAFNASGVSTSGGLVNISGGAHNTAYQSIDRAQAMVDLGGGNFVVTWESRDDIDGDGNGAFFRIFNANGSPITGVVMPYDDITDAQMGDQGTPGPKAIGLANGNFVVSWESENGPGDIGPVGDDMQDIYFRIYSSNGTPVTATTKANSDNTSDVEQLNGIIELTGGNFAFLYHVDENDTGNNDDYFVRTFTPNGIAAGNSLEVSGGQHIDVYCAVNQYNNGFVALNNGNFAVGWAAREGADGDESGAYYRVFNDIGGAISPVTLPYATSNPTGMGNQSSSGPILKALPNGFTIAWQSENGPGDVGPGDKKQDVYHRVIDNDGSPLCASTKTNMNNDAEEELLIAVQAIANGNFVVIYKDDEDDTGNKDDYFVRVIGGAPLQIVCPALGMITSSTPTVCVAEAFNVTVTGLQNMAMSANNEQDFGVKFVAFADPASDPYNGGTELGIVAFGSLTSGGTTASLAGISINMADPDLFIYAILDPPPGDAACVPFAQTMIEINEFPTVTFTASVDFCINDGVQNGLGSGTPTGGVYSGPGVTDNGNGSTYSFDPASAGVGTISITYEFDDNGCPGNASDEVEVFAEPNVTFTAPDDLCTDAGVQSGLGGGAPSGGVYGGPGVTDDNNGSTYSFDPASAGAGTHSISYEFTNANDCFGNASDEVEVFAEPNVTFTAPVDLCLNAGVLTGLGGGTPSGGVYSGPGVVDDGNGSTFSFDPAAVGAGTHSITYTFSVGVDCMGSAVDELEVFNLPIVTINLPDTIFTMDEIPPIGVVGGGTPIGGVYTDQFGEIDDDGNGETFSFNNTVMIGLNNFITYTFTDPNGCVNSVTQEIWVIDQTVGIAELKTLNLDIFPNPTTGILEIQKIEADRIDIFDLQGRILRIEDQPKSTLDISDLPTGMYFLKIKIGNELYSAKVVKE